MKASEPSAEVVFDALGDANRRQIILMLGDGPRSPSELRGPLGISLAGVVQHVKVLEESRLIRTEKVGRVRRCYIAPDGFAAATSWLEERKAALERNLDRLGKVLDG